MPYQYQRTPFNTSSQPVRMYQGCHGFATGGGAKDLGFYFMEWGEPVYAVESGTVVYTKSNSTCFSKKTSPTSADPSQRNPPDCAESNHVAIRGSDGFFTEYVHVLPSNNLTVGSTVQAGALIGTVDNSAITTGPHVHLARYFPKSDYKIGDNNYWQSGGTCNWTMFNVIDITPPPIYNGWVKDEDSGNWYYYINGIRQTNQWIQGSNNYYYQLNNNGVWTGSYYYWDSTTQTWYWWNNSTRTWYYWDGTSWKLY
ncbi:M23 family peptidase [Bacillus anthracis]|uniref:M23ase beta-sheet core domain-containing protein n=3 Tax=Bacillus TaxID=1386 RepID=Q6HMJ7_BACHK|nr:M23 family metallopeptidase [Bacillus sp. BRTN]AAT59231.1 conserved hypothetical protein, possible metalloendopeptidases [[Bacillus thuringiensis] serovar konkukian str. 97-27]AJI33873.1 peptidase M23 family protein [Bacillus thuringiensis]OFE39944.1 hypothetical protein BGV83_23365 [Bacillus anthracis]PFR87873.1 M23 family peptidase [Bacillus cereus]MCC0759457.1 M23 family metallopeptidase [Bacillus sp. BRTN]